MKYLLTISLSLIFFFSQAQLPIDFESDVKTEDFVDFDGGVSEVVSNPFIDGVNPSSFVAKMVRDGGAIYAGSKLLLSENLDFSVNNSLTMKVYTTAPVGTKINLKLEGNGAVERVVETTVSGEWETLRWDYTGVPVEFNYLVFLFDYEVVGNGSDNSTFYFDDITQIFGGTHIDLPVDFEKDMVNYTMSDFGGNDSELVVDPTDATNTVMKVIKTVGAATWAGTTIGTPAGFASVIPLTLEESKMTVKVWSPDAGTPIRLKVEDSDDPTHTCETETNTTLAGEWETILFDFSNQAPGTELLSIGIEKGWEFNMASIFFNFGTEGAEAGEKTYFFDEVKFGDLSVTIFDTKSAIDAKVSPNPTSGLWNISGSEIIISIEMYNEQGQLLKLYKIDSNNYSIASSDYHQGIYYAKVITNHGAKVLQLIKM